MKLSRAALGGRGEDGGEARFGKQRVSLICKPHSGCGWALTATLKPGDTEISDDRYKTRTMPHISCQGCIQSSKTYGFRVLGCGSFPTHQAMICLCIFYRYTLLP